LDFLQQDQFRVSHDKSTWSMVRPLYDFQGNAANPILGRLDILLEMSSYLAAPSEGHLEQVLHIFGYLKRIPKKRLAFDPDYPEIDE
jgi:hypothetical protein